MENYNTYLGIGRTAGIVVLVCLCLELAFTKGMFIFILMIQFVVGIYQLIAGITLFLSKRKRPTWFDNHIRYYWWITFGYFIILYLVIETNPLEGWVTMAWLFIVPWFIALYQYMMVYHLRNALIAREEEERWEKVSEMDLLENSIKGAENTGL